MLVCISYYTYLIEFQSSNVNVSITTSTVPTAGDRLSLTCTATVPERLVYTPLTFVISYDPDGEDVVIESNLDATQSVVSQDSLAFSRVVTIDPVKTSDAVKYYCIVSFSLPLNTTTSNDLNLQVYSEYPCMIWYIMNCVVCQQNCFSL